MPEEDLYDMIVCLYQSEWRLNLLTFLRRSSDNRVHISFKLAFVLFKVVSSAVLTV